MLKTKIAVLISGGGTNLQAIIDFAKSGGLKSGELALVVSDKAGCIRTYARRESEYSHFGDCGRQIA